MQRRRGAVGFRLGNGGVTIDEEAFILLTSISPEVPYRLPASPLYEDIGRPGYLENRINRFVQPREVPFSRRTLRELAMSISRVHYRGREMPHYEDFLGALTQLHNIAVLLKHNNQWSLNSPQHGEFHLLSTSLLQNSLLDWGISTNEHRHQFRFIRCCARDFVAEEESEWYCSHFRELTAFLRHGSRELDGHAYSMAHLRSIRPESFGRRLERWCIRLPSYMPWETPLEFVFRNFPDTILSHAADMPSPPSIPPLPVETQREYTQRVQQEQIRLRGDAQQ